MQKEWDHIEYQTLKAGFALPEDLPVTSKASTLARRTAEAGQRLLLDKRNHSVSIRPDARGLPDDEDPSAAFVTEVRLKQTRGGY